MNKNNLKNYTREYLEHFNPENETLLPGRMESKELAEHYSNQLKIEKKKFNVMNKKHRRTEIFMIIVIIIQLILFIGYIRYESDIEPLLQRGWEALSK